jgi:uncharacterized protein
MPITALYAGLLVPIFIILSVRVIRVRRGEKISVGDGGDATLLRRMRVHANFAEYVPLALLLIGLAESLKTDVRLLHMLGLALVAARILHAVSMSGAKDVLPMRVAGVATTFTILILAAIACLTGAARQLFGI